LRRRLNADTAPDARVRFASHHSVMSTSQGPHPGTPPPLPDPADIELASRAHISLQRIHRLAVDQVAAVQCAEQRPDVLDVVFSAAGDLAALLRHAVGDR
jgi:hypothetical protein